MCAAYIQTVQDKVGIANTIFPAVLYWTSKNTFTKLRLGGVISSSLVFRYAMSQAYANVEIKRYGLVR